MLLLFFGLPAHNRPVVVCARLKKKDWVIE